MDVSDSDTSAVWPFIPTVSAVGNPIAQLAHVDAELCSSALVFIGRAP